MTTRGQSLANAPWMPQLNDGEVEEAASGEIVLDVEARCSRIAPRDPAHQVQAEAGLQRAQRVSMPVQDFCLSREWRTAMVRGPDAAAGSVICSCHSIGRSQARAGGACVLCLRQPLQPLFWDKAIPESASRAARQQPALSKTPAAPPWSPDHAPRLRALRSAA